MILAALLLACMPTTSPIVPAAPASAALPPGAAPAAVDVLVLQPESSALGSDERAVLTQALTRALDGRDGLRVSSAVDVRQLADIEAERQATDCADDTGCLAEIGAAFGARLLVVGRVAAVGSRFIWQSSLIDVDSGVGARRVEVSAADVAGLVAKADDVARGLQPVGASTTKVLTLASGGGVLVMGLVAAGVFGVWTVAIDQALQTPTSAAAQQRAFDEAAVVPWAMVGGLGAAVAGGVVVFIGSRLE